MNNRPPEFIRGLHNLAPHHRGSVVTIGSFDGVHLGHKAIVAQVREQAGRLGLASVAMTFEPQPHEYFSGETAPARLMRVRDKAKALFAAGIDRVLCIAFNRRFSSLSAEQFVQKVLVDGLGAKYLVIGDDFRFGADRSGDYAFLQAAGQRHGFAVTDTETLLLDGERISSTRIRAALEASEFALAERLLGHPYVIKGKVIYGQQLARQWQVPTANVQLHHYRSPLSGVFAVRARLEDGRQYNGVANVGVRPTVGGENRPVLEVHIFDFSDDIYGQELAVEFSHKLREEKKFDSLDELKQQIYRDRDEAKAWFARGA
ncbi:MAG: bifunctional riboflavin kinase/FAD synthetase [Cellvibrionaceae bacterium]|nr:bifunctional riboflavin kinase/FAD synthetase [Cellvibrionaceae bacterium]